MLPWLHAKSGSFNFVGKPAADGSYRLPINDSDQDTAWRGQAGLSMGSGRTTSMYKPTKLLSLERRTDSTLNKRDENGLMYVVICMKISYVIFIT